MVYVVGALSRYPPGSVLRASSYEDVQPASTEQPTTHRDRSQARSRLSIFHIYLADGELIADGLNPLTISHTAKTISCTASGANKISNTEPNIPNKG
jgi:hypothetical protein